MTPASTITRRRSTRRFSARLLFTVIFLLSLLLPACGLIINDGDRQLVRELANRPGSHCAHISGSGGAGGATPGLPLAGGYGQGALSTAHSDNPLAVLSCGPAGSSIVLAVAPTALPAPVVVPPPVIIVPRPRPTSALLPFEAVRHTDIFRSRNER